ncbi:slit homolog 2 protein-like isoform X3 [Mytilus edulis]|uniref:slit homolog 2 protein-like isoform X3 n=1 Tax=Mytilus edulis TaxID=6550 RepID=UPI0039EFF4E5
MMYNVIVVFILCFLKDTYAQQCTQPPVPMCTCFLRTNLFCSEKNLTQVPSNIPATTTSIFLSYNQINSLDATSFSGLTSVHTIVLSFNRISSIDADFFSVLRTVKSLFLGNNKINSIDATSFSGQSSLKILDLSFNEIPSINEDFFSNFPMLTSLYIIDNNLTTFNPITNNSFGILNELGLRGNPFVCCTMKEFVDWTKTVSWEFFDGSCTDFNESTPILSFNTSTCIVPVDGRWSAWNNSTCSVTCGVGIVSSSRTCDSPLPSQGGKQCTGEANITTSCNLVDCPIDGGWSAWTNSTCSLTCGVGIVSSSRTCDSPLPSAGGKQCIGEANITTSCNLVDCPRQCRRSRKR